MKLENWIGFLFLIPNHLNFYRCQIPINYNWLNIEFHVRTFEFSRQTTNAPLQNIYHICRKQNKRCEYWGLAAYTSLNIFNVILTRSFFYFFYFFSKQPIILHVIHLWFLLSLLWYCNLIVRFSITSEYVLKEKWLLVPFQRFSWLKWSRFNTH